MQRNVLLTPNTEATINARVERILKDLGNPKPPLVLADVRTLLKLDLRFYSTADVSWLQEKIHQLKVAGRQVLSDPTTILAATRSLGLKGVLLFDRRRILLDTEQPVPKLRWNEAHEITHDILPWHQGVSHGDPVETLMPSCHEQIEAEANYGAGRLLFCGQGFVELVRSSRLSFDFVRKTKDAFGNTMTTTLWRIVEATEAAAFGLITVHPKEAGGDAAFDVRYFIRSPKFAQQFSLTHAAKIFPLIQQQCRSGRGPIGKGSIIVRDDNGTSCVFGFETFWNHHDALTIAFIE